MNAATHLELSRNSVMTGSLYPTPTCSVHVGAAARGACPTANAINASIAFSPNRIGECNTEVQYSRTSTYYSTERYLLTS